MDYFIHDHSILKYAFLKDSLSNKVNFLQHPHGDRIPLEDWSLQSSKLLLT